LLVDGLLVDPAMARRLRRLPVGITLSSYRPLGDQFETEGEFDIMVKIWFVGEDPEPTGGGTRI